MNFWHESRCPICRHPFNHFPSVCYLLHYVLSKMYPTAYKRRGRQVGEEENKAGHFSPQFNDHLLSSHPDIPGSSVGISDAETENCSLTGKESGNGAQNQVSVSDLLCAECKNLLFRPVVLNCGHVYCETCIIVPEQGIPKCQICQSLQPNGFPNVCLVLEHFLEEYFPKLYADRQNSLPNQGLREFLANFGFHIIISFASHERNLISDVSQAKRQPGQSSSVPTKVFSPWILGEGQKVHGGVGCDSCGHKPDHRFEIVPPQTIHELLYLLNPGRSDEDWSDVSEDEEDGPMANNLARALSLDVGGDLDDARNASATMNDSNAQNASNSTREDRETLCDRESKQSFLLVVQNFSMGIDSVTLKIRIGRTPVKGKKKLNVRSDIEGKFEREHDNPMLTTDRADRVCKRLGVDELGRRRSEQQQVVGGRRSSEQIEVRGRRSSEQIEVRGRRSSKQPEVSGSNDRVEGELNGVGDAVNTDLIATQASVICGINIREKQDVESSISVNVDKQGDAEEDDLESESEEEAQGYIDDEGIG
ncbi:hypothetical protein Tsubulata_050728 [Turnera subulata]|uniref:RING-type domain-containing protein n=1 Tax=Turnera subulata TaxID=218843 RepID=A0A9Q0JDJ8_9ROSI|nr:hypothetical protein Tsubulata_050728 [Turnera subulata]